MIFFWNSNTNPAWYLKLVLFKYKHIPLGLISSLGRRIFPVTVPNIERIFYHSSPGCPIRWFWHKKKKTNSYKLLDIEKNTCSLGKSQTNLNASFLFFVSFLLPRSVQKTQCRIKAKVFYTNSTHTRISYNFSQRLWFLWLAS